MRSLHFLFLAAFSFQAFNLSAAAAPSLDGFPRNDGTGEIVTFKQGARTSTNPKAQADKILARLVKVTDPVVKGAHDAEMALAGNHAYIVYEASDAEAGESPRRHDMYAGMSIVNLETLKVEAIIPFARSEQAFENEKLPPGSCFVPRIIQKDEKTLRCFFASEDPTARQSLTYYIDFDIPSRTFAKTIHRMKLKTSDGVFPMEPVHFYNDAQKHGFRQKPRDYGMYIFDSFKKIDGKICTVLNNYPGKQNALAVLEDSLDMITIIGHFNEPQRIKLSEAAINKLPDGTWMAIIRQDGGDRNYAFATSADGKTWAPAKFMDFVPNGASSKPTFDLINGVYYLGWQESTKINNAPRSVFNIYVSLDGKKWKPKYRFETDKSFQYPTFRQHNGRVWLTVTQGDTSGSRKERIMFGLLE